MPARPTRADRLFRILLRLLPAEFRADHGHDIAQVFRDERRDIHGAGVVAILGWWLRTLGGIVRVAISSHLAALRQDTAYALRMLRRTPVFTAVALATLGLGIAAATTMFSVVDAVLLRPLPFDDASRLVVLKERPLNDPAAAWALSYPAFLDVRTQSRTLDQSAAFRIEEIVIRGNSEPIREYAAFVSPELFAVLHARPELGRTFTADDNRAGAHTVIVGHDLWQRLLGGNANLDTQTLTITGTPFRVIGVMPARFDFPSQDTDIWLPIGMLAADPAMQDRTVHITSVVARLAHGATLEQARAEMAGLATTLADPGHTATAVPLADNVVGASAQPIKIATVAIGVVLLLACVNTAGLLLARAAARRRETAIRVAIGASRARLIRQHLTEGIVLALSAGAVGLVLTSLCLDLVRAGLSQMVPRADGITLDGRALIFVLAASIATSLLFAIVPALTSSGVEVSGTIKESNRDRRGRVPLRTALVVAEIALSLLLVVGAGLLAKSYWHVLNVDPGFDPRGLVTMRVSLPASRYSTTPAVVRFFHDLPAELATVPGVRTISGVNAMPISGGDSHGVITIDGRAFSAGEAPAASYRRILPNYFRTMHIPLVTGREFDDRDQGQDPKVVIISDAMARRLWPGQDPIGQRIKIGPPEREPWLTVVGVVGDVRNVGVETDVAYDTYEPHAQRPWSTMRLLVRAEGDDARVTTDVRARLRMLEPDLIVDQVQTMASRISTSELARRFSTWLIGAFAGLALLLAAVSLYGLTAYTVAARTREFGVRLVLGATPADVARHVIGRSIALGLAGIAIGGLFAAPAVRMARTLLAGVEPGDPIVWGAVACALFTVALVAAYVPARRATRVDPNVVLRTE